MLVYKLTTSVCLNSYKKRQKAKSSGPFDFCRICGCSFAIRLGNFGKTSYISTENLSVKPKREGVLRRKLAEGRQTCWSIWELQCKQSNFVLVECVHLVHLNLKVQQAVLNL